MWIFRGSPLLSILDAVFTVSPKRQYRGMVRPTTPATTGPVWIPMRSFKVSLGRCEMEWVLTAASRSKAIDAISPACLSPLRRGRPETLQNRIANTMEVS